MKKLLTTTILLAFFGWSVNAQLTITSNTTWSTNQIITQEVIINPGVTLTIEAGVTVQATFVDIDVNGIGDVGFTVNGILQLNGTPCSPVVFEPFSATSDPCYWFGIVFKSTTASNSVNNFELSYACYGVTMMTDATISGADIHNCPVGVLSDSIATAYVKNQGFVLLHNGEQVHLSQRKRESFFKVLEKL